MELLILFANPFAYVFRRIRFVALQRVFMILVRYAEWLSFENLISREFAFSYLIFRYVLEFLVRYRWSTLEDFRNELSRLRSNREHRRFHETIRESWIRAWSGLWILLPASIVLTFLGVHFFAPNLPPVAFIIIGMGVLNLCCDWILKFLQSVLFSVTRTQRPFWSMTGIDILHAILLFTVARNHGTLGIGIVFVLNTVLRISLSAFFTLKTSASVGIPSLRIPPLHSFQVRLNLPEIKTGLVIPALEFPFILLVLIYHLAMKRFDPEERLQFFFFIISPVFLAGSTLGYLYYVDFLKFRDRVFDRVFSILLRDSIRALLTYSLFSTLLAALVYRLTKSDGLSVRDFLCAGLVLFSWGVYFIGSLSAFVRGVRIPLMISGILCTLLITASWDGASLLYLSVLIPTLLGLAAILISRNPRLNPRSQWVARALIPDSTSIQGVELSRGALGFSLSDATEDLFSKLPDGSLVGFHDRRRIIWSTPDTKRLSSRVLLDIFGVYWDEELHSRTKFPESPLPEGALLWKLGEPLPKEFQILDPSEKKRFFSIMKQKVRGRGRPLRSVPLGFRPIFENGIWVGGYVWKKHGSKLK
jgi:hypothetical protein